MPKIGTNSLFKITDFSERGAEEVQNVYWYVGLFSPDTLNTDIVATSMMALLDTYLPPLQPSNVSHTIMEVDELTSNSNFTSVASTISDGTLASPWLPNFVAASIKLLRTTKETRHGFKRISAGNEANLNNNIWEASFVVTLQSLADALANNLTAGPQTILPAIVRKGSISDPSIDPDDPTTWVYNLIESATAVSRVTTQNSRKLGVGS